MTLDQILRTAIRVIKRNFPEAIYNGQLIKEERRFNPATNKNELIDVEHTDVEIIFDTLTEDEISSSEIVGRDVKLYIIADKVKDLEFYDRISTPEGVFKQTRTIQHLVGSKKALFTIVARKG